MTHGSFEPQAAILGLSFCLPKLSLRNRCRKERGLLLIWGPAPDPRDFLRHPSLSSDESEGGSMTPSCMPLSSSDELTELFLSAVASPQSRPPLHPMPSPYKRPHPTQVLFRIRHNISFTPVSGRLDRMEDEIEWATGLPVSLLGAGRHETQRLA